MVLELALCAALLAVLVALHYCGLLDFVKPGGLKRKPRVRLHMVDPNPHFRMPSVEGLLISRRHREYAVAVPELITSAEGSNLEMEGRLLVIPREYVAFYEVL